MVDGILTTHSWLLKYIIEAWKEVYASPINSIHMVQKARRQLLLASSSVLAGFAGCSTLRNESTIDLRAVGAENRTDRTYTFDVLVADESNEEVIYWESKEVESGTTWWHEFGQEVDRGQFTVRVRVDEMVQTASPHEWELECTRTKGFLEQSEEKLQLSIPEANIDCERNN